MGTELAAIVRAAGDHVVVEAVPGAGKTRVIVEIADAHPGSLVLAYNNALAAEIQSVVDPAHTACCTFHALCSRYLRAVRDDLQLLDAVEAAERGELTVSDAPPTATTILIDEVRHISLNMCI